MRGSFIVLSLLLFCPAALAHGFANTQQAEQHNRTIEFGITNSTPAAGDRVGMSFSIDANGTPISADTASIRISQGDAIFFVSSGFRLSNQTLLTISYTFPAPGTYDIDFAAANTSTTFHVNVTGDKKAASYDLSPMWMILAAIAGASAAVLIFRRKSKAQNENKEVRGLK